MEEDTEWNDILRSKGILPPKPPSEKELEYAHYDGVIDAQRNKDPLDSVSLDELDELDNEDNAVFQAYRQKRLAEIQTRLSGEIFGELYHTDAESFVRDVSEASKQAPVLVHLYQRYIDHCKLINGYLTRLAPLNRKIKMVAIIANHCIKDYPDRNVPTLLFYKDGDLKTQLVGSLMCGGFRNDIANFVQLVNDSCSLEIGVPRNLE